MHIADYFQEIEKVIRECPAIIMKEVFYDQRTQDLGFIKGILTFRDSSQLHFKEFVDSEKEPTRYMYGYHYQKGDKLLFRYDNYLHSPKLNLPLHHKHLSSPLEFIAVNNPPSLASVLREIIILLP